MPESPLNAAAVKSALIRMMDGPMGPMADEPKTAPEKKSHTGMHASLGVMAGGQVADALTTIAALKRSGTEEGNPVYGRNPSAGKVLGIKAATMIPIALLLDRLHDKHPKLAKGLALGVGGLGAGVAMHNAQVGKK